MPPKKVHRPAPISSGTAAFQRAGGRPARREAKRERARAVELAHGSAGRTPTTHTAEQNSCQNLAVLLAGDFDPPPVAWNNCSTKGQLCLELRRTRGLGGLAGRGVKGAAELAHPLVEAHHQSSNAIQ